MIIFIFARFDGERFEVWFVSKICDLKSENEQVDDERAVERRMVRTRMDAIAFYMRRIMEWTVE
jgi:hypothetical protein